MAKANATPATETVTPVVDEKAIVIAHIGQRRFDAITKTIGEIAELVDGYKPKLGDELQEEFSEGTISYGDCIDRMIAAADAAVAEVGAIAENADEKAKNAHTAAVAAAKAPVAGFAPIIALKKKFSIDSQAAHRWLKEQKKLSPQDREWPVAPRVGTVRTATGGTGTKTNKDYSSQQGKKVFCNGLTGVLNADKTVTYTGGTISAREFVKVAKPNLTTEFNAFAQLKDEFGKSLYSQAA